MIIQEKILIILIFNFKIFEKINFKKINYDNVNYNIHELFVL
jgi:hypothetical protein